MSRQDSALRSRHYSFDATDPAGLASFANAKFDYDQTEGMGGLSVSSYDSVDVDDDRVFDVRGHGEFFSFLFILLGWFEALRVLLSVLLYVPNGAGSWTCRRLPHARCCSFHSSASIPRISLAKDG